MDRVAIGVKRSDQCAQTRRQNNEISSIHFGSVSMGDACRNEYCRSGTRSLRPIGIAKNQFAFQDMPRFVVAMMNVQCGRTTAAPLMYLERPADC